MRLISLAVLTVSVITQVAPQNVHHSQFPFPPQFPKPNQGNYPSDSPLLLPPENPTAIPYFPMKNINKLPFQYLPPTGTKAPYPYPSPFPLIVSSTAIPNFDDDEDDDDNEPKINLSSPPPPPANYHNRSENAPAMPQDQRKTMRSLPQTVSYRHPIDRADIKFPFRNENLPSLNQPAGNRRMIITTEMSRSDQVPDQIKAASYQGPHFIPPPVGFASPTTEPAIPIVRLSNEMDLDGSYSYEALGADQTHYVQHSRMENMGTDKEEQVVEGSYSYVGDNGQTYTVHYVADANGFRASGDHLPVAPPVPEIIQRAVQYNLAEEAKKPAHLKGWQDDDYNNYADKDRVNHERVNHFVLPAQHPPSQPPRNLFTGRTPEAFSYSYAQKAPQEINNNLEVAASNQVPVKTVDFKKEQAQAKSNSGPIAPQITFLASQGAHLPSINTQPSISRMFTTEKSSLPQLMNYEAAVNAIHAANKESEKDNKALWRWQYGMNSNNETPNKSSISRSFGEGDDVMINFGEMTPDEYTNMIRSQFDVNGGANTIEATQTSPHGNQIENSFKQNMQNIGQYPTNQNYIINNLPSFPSNSWYNEQAQQQTNQEYQQSMYTQPEAYTQIPQIPQTVQPITMPVLQENSSSTTAPKVEQSAENTATQRAPAPIPKSTAKPQSRDLFNHNSYSSLITRQHFIPPSQTVTQSYDYEDEADDLDDIFELRRMKSYNLDTLKIVPSDPPTAPHTNQENQYPVSNYGGVNYDEDQSASHKETKLTTTPNPTLEIKETTSLRTGLRFSDFIVKDNKDDFKPIINIKKISEETTTAEPATTTENNVEEMLENNIFLKNLFTVDKVEPKIKNSIPEEQKPQVVYKSNGAEPKSDKNLKFTYSKSLNEHSNIKKKPMDMSQVLNYVSYKNNFESSKMKPKSKQLESSNHAYYSNPRIEEAKNHQVENHNPKHHEELRGVIKNYKVLQRNNNGPMMEHNKHNIRIEYEQPMRMLQHSNLPPLGRAGPSAKSYLPPIYV